MNANIIKGSEFNYLLAINIAKQNWQPIVQNKVCSYLFMFIIRNQFVHGDTSL
jgi:hypothetical protein